MYLIISNSGRVIYRTQILSLMSTKWKKYDKNPKYKGYKFVQIIEENFNEENKGKLLLLQEESINR